jgi:SOS-response transcriptional repressor LexA
MEEDIVVVDTSLEATIGHMVVALVDGGYTVKFYMKDSGGTHYFQAANKEKDYPDIYPHEDSSIFGVVTGAVRSMV